MDTKAKRDGLCRAHTLVLVALAIPLLSATWMFTTISSTFWPLFLAALTERLPGPGDIVVVTQLVTTLVGFTAAAPLCLLLSAMCTVELARRWTPRLRGILQRRSGTFVVTAWFALSAGLCFAYSAAHSRGVLLLQEKNVSGLLTVDALATALIASCALIGTAAAAALTADVYRRAGVSA